MPFETAFSLTIIWGGVTSFFNQTTAARMFNASLPPWVATTSNVVYLVSGLAILGGVGWAYRNVEASGLVLLLLTLLMRTVVVALRFGYSVQTSNTFATSLIFGACILVRLHTVLKGYSIVMLKKPDIVSVATDA